MPDASDDVSYRQSVLAEIISSRRMTRSFLDRQIPSETIALLCRSALRAPGAGNTSSTEVLCLDAEEVRVYWDTTLPESRRSTFPWPALLSAPVLLVVYVQPGTYVERYNEPDKAHTGLGEAQDAWSVPYWWVDGGAAVQNVLLTAEGSGLGACFFGQFDHEAAVRSAFQVPDDRRAVGTIAVGYRDATGRQASQSTKRPRAAAASRIHHGAWTPGTVS